MLLVVHHVTRTTSRYLEFKMFIFYCLCSKDDGFLRKMDTEKVIFCLCYL